MLHSTKRAAVIAILVVSFALAPTVSAAPVWLDLAQVSATQEKAGGWLWAMAAWAWQRLAPSGEADARPGPAVEKDRWLIDPLGDEDNSTLGEQGRWLIDPLG